MNPAAGPGAAFWMLAVVMVVAALGTVTLRNMVHAALCLALALVAAGGLYLNLDADLLAGFQVLIYVGAVITLLLIAIMLIANIADRQLVASRARGGWPALLCGGLAVLLGWVLAGSSFTSGPGLAGPYDHTLQAKALSLALLDPYLLAFEVASVLLLVALLGAILVAQHTRAVELGEQPPATPPMVATTAQPGHAEGADG